MPVVEPTPTQFGLSDADVDAVRRTQDRSGKLISGAVPIATAAALALSELPPTKSLGGLLAWLAFFGLQGLVIGTILAILASVILQKARFTFDRRLRAYTKYTSARDAYEVWLSRTRREYWRSLSGLDFERELASLYRGMGYEVERTPSSGDGGVDLILRRPGRTTIVQCKATESPAGPSIVRDLYGTMVAFGANDAILASLSGCTRGVRSFIRGKPITVLDVDDVIRLQHRTGN